MREAHDLYFELLLEHNANNREYLDGWIGSIPQGSDQLSELSVLSTKLRKSIILRKRIFLLSPLSEDFSKEFVSFFTFYLDKQIPTLFSLVSDLIYNENCVESKEKRNFLIQFVSDKYPDKFGANLLLSNLYRKEGDFELAHKYVDLAMGICNSNDKKLAECYFVKSKVCKKQNDISNAIDWIQKTRLLNPKDRYLNSKTSKYLLQAGRIEEALEVMKLFFKEEKIENIKEYLEMQPIWFCSLISNAYLRRGEKEKALEYSCKILEYFEEMHYDQFDFHWYCIRKMTLYQYLELIDVSSELFKSKHFVQTVQTAVEAYLLNDQSLSNLLQNLSISSSSSNLILIKRCIERLEPQLVSAEMKKIISL